MVKSLNGKKGRIFGKTTKIRLQQRMSPAKLQAVLLMQDHLLLFTTQDIRRLSGLSPRQTQRAVQDAIKEEILVRMKPGLYALTVRPPGAFIAANSLMEPSYISLESALSYYRIIPETVYSITSMTPKYPATMIRVNREFVYHQLNPALYFGYRNQLMSGGSVLIAEKEKAILDYLYFVVQGLRNINHRFYFSTLDLKRLRAHALIFDSVLKGRKRVAFNHLLTSLKLL